jgi:hypothetical protein
LGVGGAAGRLVAVGAAGRLVGVGGTVVGVGVSVTSGVGVTVGVSVGMGVGLSTGVGEWVDVGVKVGLGVLVDVGVAVGDPTNEVREQPRRLTVTSRATSATAVDAASFLPVIFKSTDLLSPGTPGRRLQNKPKRELEDLPPLERSPPETRIADSGPNGRRTRRARTCAGRRCPSDSLSLGPCPVNSLAKGVRDHPGS